MASCRGMIGDALTPLGVRSLPPAHVHSTRLRYARRLGSGLCSRGMRHHAVALNQACPSRNVVFPLRWLIEASPSTCGVAGSPTTTSTCARGAARGVGASCPSRALLRPARAYGLTTVFGALHRDTCRLLGLMCLVFPVCVCVACRCRRWQPYNRAVGAWIRRVNADLALLPSGMYAKLQTLQDTSGENMVERSTLTFALSSAEADILRQERHLITPNPCLMDASRVV